MLSTGSILSTGTDLPPTALVEFRGPFYYPGLTLLVVPLLGTFMAEEVVVVPLLGAFMAEEVVVVVLFGAFMAEEEADYFKPMLVVALLAPILLLERSL